MRIYFVFILCLLCGCGMQDIPNGREQISEKVKLAQEIRSHVARKLMKEKGLIPWGSGGGGIDQIEMLALSFQYRKPITMEEGRDLLLTAVHEFIDAINRDERIHPYLASYPFGSERIEIVIFIEDSKGDTPSSVVNVVSCRNGICRYEIYDLNPVQVTTVLKETLTEAEYRMQEHALQRYSR